LFPAELGIATAKGSPRRRLIWLKNRVIAWEVVKPRFFNICSVSRFNLGSTRAVIMLVLLILVSCLCISNVIHILYHDRSALQKDLDHPPFPINPSPNLYTIRLPSYQPIRPSAHHPITPSAYQPIRPSDYHPIRPSAYQPIRPSDHHPITPSDYQTIRLPSYP
jgi:hypothetical protein